MHDGLDVVGTISFVSSSLACNMLAVGSISSSTVAGAGSLVVIELEPYDMVVVDSTDGGVFVLAEPSVLVAKVVSSTGLTPRGDEGSFVVAESDPYDIVGTSESPAAIVEAVVVSESNFRVDVPIVGGGKTVVPLMDP